MFDHVTIRASDLDAAKRFYDLAFAALDFAGTPYVGPDLLEWHDFSVAPADEGHPATRRLHVGFAASSRDHVDAFWRALTEAGYHDDGAPGERDYHRGYYGGFVLDPDGNSAEAVHHARPPRADGCVIDHVWIRVRDVGAARRFYDAVALLVQIEPTYAEGGLVGFRGQGPSFFYLVQSDEPTEHVHLAFAVEDNAAVDEFHRIALAAGYRDNGAPGERPDYHPGYYGAYVLDPDGHNVEAVCHNRD